MWCRVGYQTILWSNARISPKVYIILLRLSWNHRSDGSDFQRVEYFAGTFMMSNYFNLRMNISILISLFWNLKENLGEFFTFITNKFNIPFYKFIFLLHCRYRMRIQVQNFLIIRTFFVSCQVITSLIRPDWKCSSILIGAELVFYVKIQLPEQNGSKRALIDMSK